MAAIGMNGTDSDFAPAARVHLDAVVGAYKQRFHQDAVGIVSTPICVAFR
jgi:hypothetical protein